MAEFDETPEQGDTVTVKALTAKEIKNKMKPIFAADPDQYYPTTTLRGLGFHRAKCPKCGVNYWRRTEARDTCGDSDWWVWRPGLRGEAVF